VTAHQRTMNAIVAAVAEALDVSPVRVRQGDGETRARPGSRVAEARAVAAWIAVRRFGLEPRAVARWFGGAVRTREWWERSARRAGAPSLASGLVAAAERRMGRLG